MSEANDRLSWHAAVSEVSRILESRTRKRFELVRILRTALSSTPEFSIPSGTWFPARTSRALGLYCQFGVAVHGGLASLFALSLAR